jgi:hypothetical protein
MNPADYKPQDFAWSQRDLRWSWKKLGGSKFDVGHYGCAAVACNYIWNRYLKDNNRPFMRPGEFIDFGNKNGKFNSQGLISWNIVDLISKGKLLNTWNPNDNVRYILQEVHWGPYLHWIVLLDGDLCRDPWDGKIKKRVQSFWAPTGRKQYFKIV